MYIFLYRCGLLQNIECFKKF